MSGRPDWVRSVALGVVAASAAVLSYATLRDVATHAGFPPWACWFYPAAVDATIVGGSRAWRDAALSRRTRRLAATVTIGAIVAGVAAFVAEHIDHGPVAVAFAALVPLALASVLVLTSWSATDRRDLDAARDELRDATALRQAAQTDRDTAQTLRRQARAAPPRPARPAPPTVSPPAATPGDNLDGDSPASPDVRRQWVREQLAAGLTVSGADVDRRFGAPRNGARIVRSVVEADLHPPQLTVAR